MNTSHLTQIAKYGGEEGYRAEMKRRRSLVKNHRGGAFKDPEFAREAARLSAIKRKKDASQKEPETASQGS